MRASKHARGFFGFQTASVQSAFDEQGREIPLPDIDDEEGEAAVDEDDFEEEAEAADEPEDDPYGLAGGWFDRYEQICFARVAGTDGLYQIAAPDGSARLYFAAVAGRTLYQLVAVLDRNGLHSRISYGDNGLPQAVYDAAGRKLTLTFVSVRLDRAGDGFEPDSEAGVFRAEDGHLYVNRLSAVTFDCYTPSYKYHLEAIHQLLKLLDDIKIRFSL